MEIALSALVFDPWATDANPGVKSQTVPDVATIQYDIDAKNRAYAQPIPSHVMDLLEPFLKTLGEEASRSWVV